MLNRFNRANWFFQGICYFLITPLVQIFQGNNLPLVWCQAADRLADLPLPDTLRGLLLVTGFAAVAALAAVYVSVGFMGGDGRQAEVAARSRQVMPFDLDRTTHRFTKSATGGLQTVVADDPADTRQIALIREHLTEETAAFRGGDYGDPASIHGGGMPGLRDLEAGHERIDVRYTETADGAQISYITSDASLVGALHAGTIAARRFERAAAATLNAW